jgi:flagellar basal body rod protein FlgG
VALEAGSRGFICVQLPNAVSYTRDGRFAIDTSGRLVSLSGSYPIINEYGGDIIIPQGADISISRSGVVYADGDVVGKIKVNVFSNKGMDTLASLNGSFFVSTSGEEPELVPEGEKKYSVLQGFIEESNVTKAIIGDVAYAKNSSNAVAKASKVLARVMSSAVQAAQP